MRLHVVGGFLGSGKTTAIARAARLSMDRGVRVAVITNDQGKNLVDSLFMDLQHTPRTEVTGGCFCCRFDDFNGKLASLAAEEKPELIFAEAVGSCADVVATVISPIAHSLGGHYLEALGFSGAPTFSVFCDARFLARRLAGETLPFSDDLLYLFDKQLEEAGLIIVNKVDLLDDREELAANMGRRFPGRPWRFQSSLNDEDVLSWLNVLRGSGREFSGHPESIDYGRYGRAEASLAWADAVIDLQSRDASREMGGPFVGFLRRLVDATVDDVGPVGHAKVFLGDAGGQGIKISFVPDGNDPFDPAGMPRFFGALRAVINIRAAGEPSSLESVVKNELRAFAEAHGLRLEIKALNVFSPEPPSPPARRGHSAAITPSS